MNSVLITALLVFLIGGSDKALTLIADNTFATVSNSTTKNSYENKNRKKEDASKSIEKKTETAVYEESEEEHEEGEEDAAKKDKVKAPVYFEFEKPIVVNLDGSSGVRFLQVQVALMSFKEANIEKAKAHMPVIKHNLVMLFSSQNFAQLQTIEGKKKLQKDSLELIQKELKRITGKPLIDELYLPSIIGQ